MQCLLTVICFVFLKSKDGQQSHGGKKDPGVPNVRSFKEHSQRQAELRKQRVRKGSVLNMLDIYKSEWPQIGGGGWLMVGFVGGI